MRTGWGYWTVFLVLGASIWLTSANDFAHPVYRLVVMPAALSWVGHVVRTPKSS